MMNLVAKTPSCVSSSTSVSLGRDIAENKVLGNSLLQMMEQGNLIDSLQQITHEKKLLDNHEKKLFDNHEKKLLDSNEEKFLDKQISSNQSQNQSVIDQGNLITNTKCLLMKAKHPGLEIKEKSVHEELCYSYRSGAT